MFPDSIAKIRVCQLNTPTALDANILSVQHERCRLTIEAKEEIETQLKEMMTQIINPQVKHTAWVSSLTYLCKANGMVTVCLYPKITVKP